MRYNSKYLMYALLLLVATCLMGAFRYSQCSEGFQATGPQMLCALEYAKNNPATVTDKRLQKYIAAFDLAAAKKSQSLATNVNAVLKKVQSDGMSGPLNTYYNKVRGTKAIISCMKQTYAI